MRPQFLLICVCAVIFSFGAAAITAQATHKNCMTVLASEAPSLSLTTSAESEVITKWLMEWGYSPTRAIQSLSHTDEFQRFVAGQKKSWGDPELQQKIAYNYIESRWQQLTETTERQRAALLYLDLVKIGLKPGEFLDPFAAKEILQEISAKNLQTLISRLREKAPDLSHIEPSEPEKVRAAVSKFQFQFVKFYKRVKDKARAPILPERELSRMGLNKFPSYWERFINGATSVGLSTTAENTPWGQLDVAQLIVDKEWVLSEGMALPGITNVVDLFILFNNWKPEVFRKYLMDQRYYLSSDELEPISLLRKPQLELEARFPPNDEKDRLLPLRKQLLQFALTPSDLRTFLRENLYLYIMEQYSKSAELGRYTLEQFAKYPEGTLESAVLWSGLPASWIVRIPAAIPRARWHTAATGNGTCTAPCNPL